MSDYTREAFERDRFATAGPVQPPATPQEPEQTWGPFFDQCEKCVTRTHCAHHDRCLAECVPADLRASTQGQTTWQPIETVPKDGTRIDLWAKSWLPAFDRFEFRRFADCYWSKGDTMCNVKAAWAGLDREWHPTHWMPLPSPPTPEGTQP